jgi:hypothetical protein
VFSRAATPRLFIIARPRASGHGKAGALGGLARRLLLTELSRRRLVALVEIIYKKIRMQLI